MLQQIGLFAFHMYTYDSHMGVPQQAIELCNLNLDFCVQC